MKIEIKNPEDLRIIRAGLKLYVRNARAAGGTMKGLAKDGIATSLSEEAEDVEQRLVAMFDEQGTLPLAGSDDDGDDDTPAKKRK